MNKITKLSAALFFGAFLAMNFAVAAYALDSAFPVKTDYKPLTTIPGAFQVGVTTNPVKVIAGIYGLAIGIGSVIAVIMIIVAGFQYMYQESIEGKSDAKQRITNAFIGLFVMIGSYILLNTINPDLVKFDVTLGGGTGKLAGLTAIQNELDVAQAAVAKANRDTAAKQVEIDQLTNTSLPAKDKEIGAIQDRIAKAKAVSPATTANNAVIKSLEDELAQLQSDKQGIQSQIAIKTFEKLADVSKNNSTVGQDSSIGNELSSLAGIKKENGDVEAILAVQKTLDNISNHTDSKILLLQGNINEAKKMNVSGDAAKARDEYISKTTEDLKYLSSSREFTTEVSKITAYYIGPSSDTASTNSDFSQKNMDYNRLLATYNSRAADFDAIGRKDLGDQLAKDMDKVTEIMKIKFTRYCASISSSARQELTLCSQ